MAKDTYLKRNSSPQLVAARLKWLLGYSGKNKRSFAASIDVLPSQLSMWLSGSNRVSLEGALKIHYEYGVSLDFLFLGRSEALSESMYKAWQGRNLEKDPD